MPAASAAPVDVRLRRRQAIEGLDRLIGFARSQLRAAERIEDAQVVGQRNGRFLRRRQRRARIVFLQVQP